MSHASAHRVGRIGRGISLFISGIAMATLSVATHAQTPGYINVSGQVDPELVGTQTTFPLIFTVAGSPVTIDSVTVSGTSNADYSVTKNTCVAGLVLTSTTTCEIDVVFAPTQWGPTAEGLSMATSSGPQNFDLGSYGELANFLVSPTQLDFGFQPVGTTSAPRTVTFTNPNPIAATVPTDAYAPYYTFVAESGFCETIPANGSCSYEIVFQPHTTGTNVLSWYVPVGLQYDGSDYIESAVALTGEGVQDGASAVTLPFNVVGISNDGGEVPHGGLDGDGNVYSNDFLPSYTTWSGQTFPLGYGTYSALHQATVALPTGQYYGATLLATGVNGNQVNQAFTVTYSDGTTSVVHQSLSDWKTPQHYLGESIAVTTPYRLTVTGATHTGPYYLYAYTLPLDHTKTAVSLTLPSNPNVDVLALNVGVAGVPVTADLTSLYNVTAVGVDGQAVTGGGIDAHSTAISYAQISQIPLNELLLAVPPYNQPDAVANLTVPLPSGLYSTLHLDGMAVEGNEPTQTLTINYQDGTSTVLAQGFSDWHTSQKYTHESIAVAMPYKLNPDGSKHTGTYNLYQYDIPIDATKLVSSVVLPKTRDIVILSVALKP